MTDEFKARSELPVFGLSSLGVSSVCFDPRFQDLLRRTSFPP
jgi:hypothetical protein